MSDELYQYYQQELTFFRQMAGEFAQKYPKVAGRLQLDESKESADPHVERLIESFALLTSRVRRKLDEEFPEVIESLLDLIYPHYLRPIPPMAVAQFRYEPQQAGPAEPVEIPAGTMLSSRDAGAHRCLFRTVYDAWIQPLAVAKASLGSVSIVPAGFARPAAAAFALRLQVEPPGTPPAGGLRLPNLRFFLNGEGTPVHLLYELLFAHAVEVNVRPRKAGRDTEAVRLGPECIRPVGFEIDEGLLPYSNRSFPGYRLLQEYFHFPQKFFFFDLSGLDQRSIHDPGGCFDLLIFFRDSELRDQLPSIAQAVGAEMFQLGCTPIVNLFACSADTIRVSHKVTEYPVIPDRHRLSSMEVYSVDRVTSSGGYGQEEVPYEPFYSFRHARHDSSARCFWYAHRRPSPRKDDPGTDVYLSLVDLDFKSTDPASEHLTAYVTCSNRDYVSRIEWRKEWGELEGEGLPQVQIRCVVPPTKTMRPPLRGSLQWRLLSHLSLNHLSIQQAGGLEALQEILRLYVFSDDEEIRRRIAGITRLDSGPDVSPLLFPSGLAFCRGLSIGLEFDELQYAGSGVFLLGAVLERFLGLYTAVNSYSRVAIRSRQRAGVIKQWPARIGQQRVL